jgi:anaerobic magnesium-protoporphyrin IX monomethyl ester cyclase
MAGKCGFSPTFYGFYPYSAYRGYHTSGWTHGNHYSKEKKMKVALIVPVSHYKDKYPSELSLSDFPTGFAYLASSLKQAEHEVIGVNPNNISGYPSAKIMLQSVLSREISQHKPDLIATGGLCTDYLFLKDCIEMCRKLTNVPIVLGGQIVTNDAEDIFNLLKPDYVIVGEAEQTLVDLANSRLHRNDELAVRILPLFGGKEGQYVKDLDTLPFPDYEPFNVKDMLDNHSMATRLLYRYPRPYPRPFVIVASRSCPFSCTFCIHGKRDAPYRARSINNIMAEIKETYAKYHYNILLIDDELFAVNKERMNEFSRRVLQGKEELGWDFDWMFQTHASAKLDLESLKLARQAGCFLFSYGLESASPTILKSMNKRIKVSQVIEAMKLAHEAKIGFSANLIFGDIAETAHTMGESMAFWFGQCREDFVFMTNLMPYPGSKIFDGLIERGAFKDKKLYYENIDKGVINITNIPQVIFEDLCKVMVGLETSWLFVSLDTNVRIEEESSSNGMSMYKVWGTCPYCGKESLYRQPMATELKGKFSIGTGCLSCNRKIKILT